MLKKILIILLSMIIALSNTGCDKKRTYLSSDTKFRIERYERYNSLNYYQYYKKDNRIIYFAGDIKEFYIIDGKEITLKKYIKSYKSISDSINNITEKMDEKDELNDGGSIIYKSKDLNLAITVCKSLSGNKNIYFNDYNQYEETMCK